MKYFVGFLIGVGLTVLFFVGNPFYYDPSNTRVFEKQFRLENKIILIAGNDPNSTAWTELQGPDSGYDYSFVIQLPNKEAVEEFKIKLKELPRGFKK